MESIRIVAKLEKVVAQGDKATVTLTMGQEMAYLAPRIAEMAGETVVATVAPYQESLPLGELDG